MQFSIEFAFRVNLQEERCEQWVSDAGRLISLLLCDIASLSRLSITFDLAAGFETANGQPEPFIKKPYLRGGLYHSGRRRIAKSQQQPDEVSTRPR
jgi:hypothetical protein